MNLIRPNTHDSESDEFEDYILEDNSWFNIENNENVDGDKANLGIIHKQCFHYTGPGRGET